MTARDKKMRKFENKIKYWSEYIDEIVARANRVADERLAAADSDAQREKWEKYRQTEVAKAARLREEHVVPAEEGLQQCFQEMIDEPDDGLDA